VLAPDLIAICRALELLGVDDKPVARLWSIFADPKKIGTWQRDNLSNVPLHGHRVRGFELVAGEQRIGSKRLFRTLKSESGYWDEGPRWIEPAKTWQIDYYEHQLRSDRDWLETPAATEVELRNRHAAGGWQCRGLTADEYVAQVLGSWEHRRTATLERIPEYEAKLVRETDSYERAMEPATRSVSSARSTHWPPT
jgi:hypothetical protein